MCGIIGYTGSSRESAAVFLAEGLSLLQHRGQDAAGVVTMSGTHLAMHKGSGLAGNVLTPARMAALEGSTGIGHLRYSTSGSARALNEMQPLYVNYPYGMTLVHNGNLTNTEELRLRLAKRRHINSKSDTEILLNVLAQEVNAACSEQSEPGPDQIFDAVARLHRQCRGAYAACALIAGCGLLAFRDPNGIRPLVVGERRDPMMGEPEYMFASESVALHSLGFQDIRDVAPGEAILITPGNRMETRQCAESPKRVPCLFEYVYLARPDSVIENVLVYEARVNMGKRLAAKLKSDYPDIHPDAVIPIPDSARPAALQLSQEINVPYREGFVKNRYIGRTFIMPGQENRRRSVQRKLSIVGSEFAGKDILLVDDSIVRGTTSREIVQMAREAGARKIWFASAAPPIRHPNVYGIDMPSRSELIAAEREPTEIAPRIGADLVIYQDLEGLTQAVRDVNPRIERFDASCFDGEYVSGDIDEGYLAALEARRGARRDHDEGLAGPRQMDLSFTELP